MRSALVRAHEHIAPGRRQGELLLWRRLQLIGTAADILNWI